MQSSDARAFLRIPCALADFGTVSGGVLHECGVLGRSRWSMQEFSAICQRTVAKFGYDNFNTMVRGRFCDYGTST